MPICNNVSQNSLTKWNQALRVIEFLLGRWSWNGHSVVTLFTLCSCLLGDRPLSWFDSFSGKMVLKGHLSVTWGKPLHIHWSGLGEIEFKPFYWDTELWVDMIVLMGRWSWKGHSLVTLRKPYLSTFIAQVSGRQSFEPFFWETELWANMMVLVARGSWKGYISVTLRKPWLPTFIVQVSQWDIAFSWCSSSNGKRVLKRPFLSDTGEALAHNIHCSCLPKRQLWADIIVLVAKLSWEGLLLVTLGSLYLFVHVLGR